MFEARGGRGGGEGGRYERERGALQREMSAAFHISTKHYNKFEAREERGEGREGCIERGKEGEEKSTYLCVEATQSEGGREGDIKSQGYKKNK